MPKIITGTNVIIKKEIIIDNNKYLLDGYFRQNYYTFAITPNHNIYCVDNDGVIQTGLIKIDNDTYYFNEDGIMQKGMVKIDNKNYFFDLDTGKLHYGFVTLDNGDTYYLDSDGTMKIGFANIEENTYYFNNEGIMQKGITNVDGKNYLLNEEGKLQYGFTRLDGYLYYTNNQGIIQTGLIDIAQDTYYFNDYGIMLIGWQNINGNTYYFKNDGRVTKSTITMGNKEYHFNNQGILEYVVNLPVYYSQKDSRWSNVIFGEKNMGGTGCGPTSLAMIFSSISGRYITPLEVANYLYNYTDEFNKTNIGMSGLGVTYAASYYGISYRGISSLDDLNNELNQGKMVIAMVGSGRFVREGYTHSIVLFNSNGKTMVYNPNPTYGSKVVSATDLIWNQRSSDPYDLKGGYLFYSFG